MAILEELEGDAVDVDGLATRVSSPVLDAGFVHALARDGGLLGPGGPR